MQDAPFGAAADSLKASRGYDAWVTGVYNCCQVACTLGQQAAAVCLSRLAAGKVNKGGLTVRW